MRNLAWLAFGGLILSACADPEMQKRIADLEAKVAQLEASKGAAPAAGAAAAPVDDAAEAAATQLLRDATTLAEAMKYDEAKAKLAELKSKYAETRSGKASARLESELEIIGKDAGNIEVDKWFQGNLANLNDGKATLLVFWEVWCPHCKREVPKLTETYNKYHGRGLNMVGLTKMTRNITEDEVNKFIKDSNVAYPIAKEKGEAMSQHYGVRGIPAAAMVKDGKIVWRGHPARLTDEMIESWIGG